MICDAQTNHKKQHIWFKFNYVYHYCFDYLWRLYCTMVWFYPYIGALQACIRLSTLLITDDDETRQRRITAVTFVCLLFFPLNVTVAGSKKFPPHSSRCSVRDRRHRILDRNVNEFFLSDDRIIEKKQPRTGFGVASIETDWLFDRRRRLCWDQAKPWSETTGRASVESFDGSKRHSLLSPCKKYNRNKLIVWPHFWAFIQTLLARIKVQYTDYCSSPTTCRSGLQLRKMLKC